MMSQPWIAVLFAVFAWWFSTGAILLIVRKSDAGDAVAHGRSVVLAVPFAALGIAGLVISATALTLVNVYLAFASTLLVWGWIELAFLAGIVTGPMRRPCPPGLFGWPRLVRAVQTVAYHELLLLAGLMAILGITAESENTVGFWTYAILFGARISAKLNLFFGVPRINTEFVPGPLQHLTSYFRQARITAMYPLGVVFLSLATGYLVTHLLAAETGPTTAGFALLTALASLALLEHLLMVVPLPDAKLWRWMLPAPTPTKGKRHEL